jgi:SAM-dependent methyltransferase
MFLEEDAFTRLDESDDRIFYSKTRMVPHLDRVALATVERVIGTLIVERNPVILDLMASLDSHIPPEVEPEEVVGLGLNRNELMKNRSLTEHVIHDLNADPYLPFPDNTFDVVLNTASVDYMTQPIEVFQDVARVLKPGGLYLVIFSNRMFKKKAVKAWRESPESERVLLVELFFRIAGEFERPTTFVSRGYPRPEDEKYAPLGIPSDPIWAVYAEKTGGSPVRRPRPKIESRQGVDLDPEVLMRKKMAVGKTLECPYCDKPLVKWEVPQTPFTMWDNEFVYVCFNNQCPYLCAGWGVMEDQGNSGFSYRLTYDPDRDRCRPAPVPSTKALRETVVTVRG